MEMKKLLSTFLSCTLAAVVATAGESEKTISLTAEGVTISFGAFQTTLGYPVFNCGSGRNAVRPADVDVAPDGLSATVQYGENETIECRLQGDVLEMKFSPEALKSKVPSMSMRLPLEFIDSGGSWSFAAPGAEALGLTQSVFPREKAKEWYSFAGNADSCRIVSAKENGDALTITGRARFYMKDERLWNCSYFSLVYFPAIRNGVSRFRITPGKASSAPSPEKQSGNSSPFEFAKHALEINCGDFRTTLLYPIYKYGENWQKHVTPQTVTIAPDGLSATLQYGEEENIECAIRDNKLVMKYSPGILKWKQPAMEMRIMQDFTENGGCWEFFKPAKDALGVAKSRFPREKATEWFSFSGIADGCRIAIADGKGDSLTVKSRTRYYMADRRLWGKCYFDLVYFPAIVNGESSICFEIGKGTESAVVLDRFGQFDKLEYADKIHSEEELRKDKEAHEKYYASFPKLDRTFWGGLPGSKEKYGLTATGFFHLEKIEALNGRTMLVDPEGNLYFHIAMSGIAPGNEATCVAGRENIYAELPAKDGEFRQAWLGRDAISFYLVNYIRKYGSYNIETWQKQMVERCRAWGFNSFGVFMWIAGENDKLGFAITDCLERYASRKPFHLICPSFIDPFDEHNFPLLEEDFSEQTRRFRGNPALIGWYTENERFYNIVFPAILAKDQEIPAKRRFAEMMRERYHGDITKFNNAWKTNFVDFEAVASKPMKEAGTPDAEADQAAYEAFFFDAYYKLLSTTLRKVDPDHLYLGERMLVAQTYHEAAVRAMGKYCDVFSVNYYTDEYDPAEIERFAKSSGRPLMLSEWSFGSPEQGLFGCRNKANDEERGKAYSRYAENAAASSCVIGFQWMNLLDESNTGRGFNTTTGERFNMGFINVCDRPFKKLAAHAAASNAKLYDLVEGKAEPVPVSVSAANRAENRILGIGKVKPGIAVDALRTKYPERPGEVINRSVAGRNPSRADRADMICGWDEEYLYILLTVRDDTPASNTHNHPIWQGDAIEVFVGADPDAAGKMRPQDRQLAIRVNTEPTPDFGYDCNGSPVKDVPAPQSRVRVATDRRSYSIEIAFPWKAAGITPKVGMKFKFDVAINFSGEVNTEQSNKLIWNGLEENYFRRDLWGVGVLED